MTTDRELAELIAGRLLLTPSGEASSLETMKNGVLVYFGKDDLVSSIEAVLREHRSY